MNPELTLGIGVLIGIGGGFLSGLIGIGGGVIIIPALVLLLGMPQATAQGTTLAMMIPPIGIFAVLAYYQRGAVDLKMAAVLCVGFVLGSIFGAKFALAIPEEALKKVFGVLLLIIGGKMLIH